MIDRSQVFSILKCEFGWNGVTPETLDPSELERAMVGQKCASKCANKMGILLAKNGATFIARIDGKPNRRFVVRGIVYVRAA